MGIWKLLALCAALSGCGYSSGGLRGANSSVDVQIRIDASRVAYVKTVTGSATTRTVFCLMPVNDGNRYSGAMAELRDAARLKPNQFLANVREDTVTMFYLFFCSTELTVSAEIVEVTPSVAPSPAVPAPPPAAPAAQEPTK